MKSKYLPSTPNLIFGGIETMAKFAPLKLCAMSGKKPSIDNYATSIETFALVGEATVLAMRNNIKYNF